LRESEDSLQKDVTILSAKIQILQQTLVINNVAIPDLSAVGAMSHLLSSSVNRLDLSEADG
jgi:hypothetical protein